MTELRSRILDHAGELYLESGLEGFSMRKLARRVGVTAPALYRHFDSRNSLLTELVREASRTMIGYLAQALVGDSPMDRIGRAGRAYLDFALDHPRYFHLFSTLCDRSWPEEMPEVLGPEARAVQQFWEDRVRECIEAGVFRPGDPEEIGLTLWAHAYGLVTLYLSGALPVTTDELRSIYMGSCIRVLRGLGTPEAFPDPSPESETETTSRPNPS